MVETMRGTQLDRWPTFIESGIVTAARLELRSRQGARSAHDDVASLCRCKQGLLVRARHPHETVGYGHAVEHRSGDGTVAVIAVLVGSIRTTQPSVRSSTHREPAQSGAAAPPKQARALRGRIPDTGDGVGWVLLQDLARG